MLAPGGVLVVNVFNGARGSPARSAVGKLGRQLHSSVGAVYSFPVVSQEESLVLVARRDRPGEARAGIYGAVYTAVRQVYTAGVYARCIRQVCTAAYIRQYARCIRQVYTAGVYGSVYTAVRQVYTAGVGRCVRQVCTAGVYARCIRQGGMLSASLRGMGHARM